MRCISNLIVVAARGLLRFISPGASVAHFYIAVEIFRRRRGINERRARLWLFWRLLIILVNRSKSPVLNRRTHRSSLRRHRNFWRPISWTRLILCDTVPNLIRRFDRGPRPQDVFVQDTFQRRQRDIRRTTYHSWQYVISEPMRNGQA
jgi:hypothetical protein